MQSTFGLSLIASGDDRAFRAGGMSVQQSALHGTSRMLLQMGKHVEDSAVFQMTAAGPTLNL